jgi:glycosyltransferase involved in cell wall biosynthesis
MAMGLPAICTAVGGVPEMLGGRGWLTVPGDSNSMVAALLEVAENPALAHERAMRARAFVLENYDSRETLRRYQSLLLDSSRPLQESHSGS